MRNSRMRLAAAIFGMASLANAIPDPRQGKEISVETRRTKRRRPTMSDLFRHSYGKNAQEIREWNKKVDQDKDAKLQKRLNAPRREKKPRLEVCRTVRGATYIRDLIWNYQVHSSNVTAPATMQRRAEYYEIRRTGRSHQGIVAEAEHMHKAKKKFTRRVSENIGGRTLRVIERLIRLQDIHADNKRTADWANWDAVGDGIWQYGDLPYFMFNDETGELFEYNPEKLHFPTMEICNEAIRLYAVCISRDKPEDADQVFKDFCEQHGRTLVASDEVAGDENYALEG